MQPKVKFLFFGHKRPKYGKISEIKIWKVQILVYATFYNKICLFYEFLGGHTDTAKILLENKADKNLKNNDNRTPLEEAKFHENRGVANFIENWVDPES